MPVKEKWGGIHVSLAELSDLDASLTLSEGKKEGSLGISILDHHAI